MNLLHKILVQHVYEWSYQALIRHPLTYAYMFRIDAWLWGRFGKA